MGSPPRLPSVDVGRNVKGHIALSEIVAVNDGGGRRDQPGELILGRDNELLTIQRLVADADSGRCLVVARDPGIGKTTLWEQAVERGRSHGDSVVLAQASQAEAALLFAALADLLEGVSLTC